MKTYRTHLMVCAGTGCVSCGSLNLKDRLESELKDRGLSDEVRVVVTGCNGFCAEGPIMVVYPEGIFYKKLTSEDIPFLVEEHFLKGRPVERFLIYGTDDQREGPSVEGHSFFPASGAEGPEESRSD